jgi:prophage tail gpP-like protein
MSSTIKRKTEIEKEIEKDRERKRAQNSQLTVQSLGERTRDGHIFDNHAVGHGLGRRPQVPHG